MFFLLGFILAAALVVLFMPKGKIPESNTNTPSLDGFEAPTSDRTRVIPEVFGTTLIKSGNLFATTKPRYVSIMR